MHLTEITELLNKLLLSLSWGKDQILLNFLKLLQCKEEHQTVTLERKLEAKSDSNFRYNKKSYLFDTLSINRINNPHNKQHFKQVFGMRLCFRHPLPRHLPMTLMIAEVFLSPPDQFCKCFHVLFYGRGACHRCSLRGESCLICKCKIGMRSSI